ncbi:zeta subunit of DNA polymerase [Trichoderma ceciliae]
MSASPPPPQPHHHHHHDHHQRQEEQKPQPHQQHQKHHQHQVPSGLSLPLHAATPVLSAFTSFLTIAIHSLLYHRNLYPATSFLTARAYNLPVHQSRHPGVCAWINDAISAIANQLHVGVVKRIVLVVHGAAPQLKVCERWVFDVERFTAWGTRAEVAEAAGQSEASAAAAAPASRQQQDDDELLADEGDDTMDRLDWADMHEALRGALQRLAYAAQGAETLPPGCTFTLALELREQAEAPIGHPQPWIPSESHLQPPTREKPDQGESLGGTATKPIRSVRADPLFFECWLEQGSPDPEVVNSNAAVVTSTSSESIPR